MAKPAADTVVDALLERHGQTYAQELGIDAAKGTPSVLFRLLVAAILFSARIGAGQAVKAARALTDEGWTTAHKLAATSWQQRVRALNRHGWAMDPGSSSSAAARSIACPMPALPPSWPPTSPSTTMTAAAAATAVTPRRTPSPASWRTSRP